MTDIAVGNICWGDFVRPEILADPYPLYRRLRLEDPVHEDPTGRGWMVTRYDDIATVLSDRRFSAERMLSPDDQGRVANAIQIALARQMLFLDPPDHTRLRALFTKTFNPGRLETLRPQILAITTELLNAAEAAGGRIDFIRDFAVPLPISVIAQMLGVPREDRHKLRAWSLAFGTSINGRTLSAEESLEAQQGILEFIEYFRKLIQERRRQPQNDMLSDLIAVEERGDRLTVQELIVNLILLVAAGHITTTHLLGNGLFALLNRPDQWQLLGADAAIGPSAVNELLRFDAPVQATSRQALEEVRLGGKTIAKWQYAIVFLGSANRDEEHFPNPDTLDLRRADTRMLSFGHGIHACLGAALGRMEIQIALLELRRRFPMTSLEIDTPQRPPGIAFRGLVSLPITLK